MTRSDWPSELSVTAAPIWIFSNVFTSVISADPGERPQRRENGCSRHCLKGGRPVPKKQGTAHRSALPRGPRSGPWPGAGAGPVPVVLGGRCCSPPPGGWPPPGQGPEESPRPGGAASKTRLAAEATAWAAEGARGGCTRTRPRRSPRPEGAHGEGHRHKPGADSGTDRPSGHPWLGSRRCGLFPLGTMRVITRSTRCGAARQGSFRASHPRTHEGSPPRSALGPELGHWDPFPFSALPPENCMKRPTAAGPAGPRGWVSI